MSGGLGKFAGVDDKLTIDLEPGLLRRLQISPVARVTRRRTLRSADIRDLAMSEFYQMRQGQVDAEFVIVDDGRDVVLVHRAIDEHEWNPLVDTLVDQGIFPIGGRQDEAVHLTGLHILDQRLLTASLTSRVGEDCDIARAVESVFDSADDRRKDRVG